MSQIGKKEIEKDLPAVTVELFSPTSVSMKNSLMIRKSHQFESYIRNQHFRVKNNKTSSVINKNNEEDLIAEMKEEYSTPQQQLLRNPLLVKNKRPYARDGHSGLIFISARSNLPYMFVFGGDRH